MIYNAIETTAHSIPKGRAGDNVRVLSVGRLESVKGYDRLIRSLAPTGIDWHLQFAGDGMERAALEALARELQVSDRVEFLGFRSDVPELLSACDVFIQSSISEGFGVALLEAMHFAPLVISTRVGIAAEIFPDWLIWNPTDAEALARILKNRHELAARYAEWVPKQLVRFNLTTVAAEHADYYREILAK